MTDYEKLDAIIAETEYLIQHSASPNSPKFKAWHTKAERFLINHFGAESYEAKSFHNTQFSAISMSETDSISKCKRSLLAVNDIFHSYLDEMTEAIFDDLLTGACNMKFEKVFIVHGHDGELKEAVARIVEKQGIEAIILSEKANKGRTIIEKFEDYSDVGGAICLFTADDIGKAKNSTEEQYRARQNVVFEAGFFMGKLSRERVVLLADSDIEMPSDLSGVVYTTSKNWQFDLLKELNAMGYAVDANKLL